MSVMLFLLLSCTSEAPIRSLVPVLGVQPAELTFPDVGPPLSATLPLFVGNSGDADLSVSLSLDSDAFSLGADALVLAPGETAEVPVTFTPPTLLSYDAVVHLESNDPEHPTSTVPVSGRGVDLPLPDIEIEPAHTLEKEDVAVGASHEFVFQILNTGNAPLVLGDIAVDAPSVFSVLYLPSGFTLGPGDSDVVAIAYAPTSDAGEVARITIPSNDPDEPVTTVLLIGNGGGDFDRPVAVIDCPSEVLLTGPEWLMLDGSGSFDPAMVDPLTFAWTVTARPPASDASIAIDPDDTESIDLYVDVAGTWSVELVVTNALGTTSDPATCTFSAAPEDDLHVELSWSTPFADVDLHLVQEGATLFDCDEDCFYANQHPDWGLVGDQDDNPRLDLDDVVGFGPENTNIARPADGIYELYVQVYAPNDDPATTATVEVWVGGLHAWSGSMVLDLQFETWHVGTFTFPAATFAPISDPLLIVPPTSCN